MLLGTVGFFNFVSHRDFTRHAATYETVAARAGVKW